jgi:hypothetical protein
MRQSLPFSQINIIGIFIPFLEVDVIIIVNVMADFYLTGSSRNRVGKNAVM